jgi:hypothetical protein
MRRRTAVPFSIASAAAVASIAMGATTAACFDLFHSTSDILSACEIDAQSPVCGPTDFCSWSPAAARQHAQHACAWLGACETPVGSNALGPCMFQALLAYDCAANPNHRVRGAAHDLWDCLWRAQSCSDVAACAPLAGPPTCQDAGCPCQASGCFRTTLRWCDGGDVGIDCASNGAGHCNGYPSPNNAKWVACEADSDGGTCTPDPTARCANGRAQSCPSGVVETIDCQELLGTSGACVDGPLDPPFDWTSPCAMVPSACTTDSCANGSAIGCARGAAFAVDCASENLGACRMVSGDAGAEQHAACTPP